jgi:hypothetical protein
VQATGISTTVRLAGIVVFRSTHGYTKRFVSVSMPTRLLVPERGTAVTVNVLRRKTFIDCRNQYVEDASFCFWLYSHRFFVLSNNG